MWGFRVHPGGAARGAMTRDDTETRRRAGVVR